MISLILYVHYVAVVFTSAGLMSRYPCIMCAATPAAHTRVMLSQTTFWSKRHLMQWHWRSDWQFLKLGSGLFYCQAFLGIVNQTSKVCQNLINFFDCSVWSDPRYLGPIKMYPFKFLTLNQWTRSANNLQGRKGLQNLGTNNRRTPFLSFLLRLWNVNSWIIFSVDFMSLRSSEVRHTPDSLCILWIFCSLKPAQKPFIAKLIQAVL